MLPLLLALLHPCASVALAQAPPGSAGGSQAAPTGGATGGGAAPSVPPPLASTNSSTVGTAAASPPAQPSAPVAGGLNDRLLIAKLQYNRACTEAKERRLADLQRAREARIGWYEKISLILVAAVLGFSVFLPMISLWHERGSVHADEKDALKRDIEKAMAHVAKVADSAPAGAQAAGVARGGQTLRPVDLLQLIDTLAALGVRVSRLRVAPVSSAWIVARGYVREAIWACSFLASAFLLISALFGMKPAEFTPDTFVDLCTEVPVPE